MQPDEPGVLDRAMWSRTDHRIFQSGAKHFYRGVGLLTQKQTENPEYRRILARSAREARPVHATQQTTPTITLGTYVTRQRKNAAGKYKPQTYFQTRKRKPRVRHNRSVEGNPPAATTGTTTTGTSQVNTVTLDDQVPGTSGTQNTQQAASGSSSSPEYVTQATAPVQPEVADNNGPQTDSEEDDETESGGEGDGDPKLDQYRSWWADTIPVRVVQPTPWMTKMESKTKVPYSLMFTSITERLADPAATGALGSMTRGPTMVDAASVLALAKYTASSTTSVLEIAAMVRLGSLIMSVSTQCYASEIILHRMIRGWRLREYLGYEIVPEGPHYPDTFITAMPLDVFVSHCFGKSNFNVLEKDPEVDEPVFLPLDIDNTWTAIPVKMQQIQTDASVPLIGAFLTSALFSGKINHVFSGEYVSADGAQTLRTAARLMPASNSVYINSPNRVLLVLIEATSASCPNVIRIGGTDIPVFTNRANVREVDFTQIWVDWFNNGNVHRIEHDSVLALRHHTDNN